MGRAIPFSDYELQEIERMINQNFPIKRIADHLSRSERGVENKIHQFGGILRFSAKKAIEHRRNILKKYKNSPDRKIKEKSAQPTQVTEVQSLSDRIEALEMQIQILTQAIRQHVKNPNHS